MNQTLTTRAVCPLGPFSIARIVYAWPRDCRPDAVASCVGCWARRAAANSSQRSAEYAERPEETGLEPPDWMAGRQQIPVKLFRIDLRASGVWTEHDGI